MATIVFGKLSAPALTRSQLTSRFLCSPILRVSSLVTSKILKNHIFTAKIRSAAIEVADPVVDEKIPDVRKNILACPICYTSLRWKSGDPGLSVDSAAGSSLECSTCRKTYFGSDTHLDLRVAYGGKAYRESLAASTEFFRTERFLHFLCESLSSVIHKMLYLHSHLESMFLYCCLKSFILIAPPLLQIMALFHLTRFPLISFLYERGWRQSFSLWGGFPGPEKEFELMKEYLQPVLGGNIIDASCGSGMFSRLFAKSGLFSLVVALDYSETMLQQCYEFIKQEENFPRGNLILVRADISRLPFPSSTVDAIHAGAALHCWPSPSAAVAEISRVLRPGGMFVATTHTLDGPFRSTLLLGPLRQNIAQLSGSHIFLSEGELEDLCTSCGLEDFKCTRNRRFVMIAARKPV